MHHFLLNSLSMPSSNVHLGFSGAVGMTGALWGAAYQGWSPEVAFAAGLAGWAGGLVPDLDSDTGKPLIWSAAVVSILVSLGLVFLLTEAEWTPLYKAELVLGFLLVFNTLGVFLFKRTTVHRGMFHSLPALMTYMFLIAAVFGPTTSGLLIGPAVVGGAGMLSHLALDAFWSVSLNPLKLWSGKKIANRWAWILCAVALGLAAWRYHA